MGARGTLPESIVHRLRELKAPAVHDRLASRRLNQLIARLTAEGYSHREIASAMGVTHQCITRRLNSYRRGRPIMRGKPPRRRQRLAPVLRRVDAPTAKRLSQLHSLARLRRKAGDAEPYETAARELRELIASLRSKRVTCRAIAAVLQIDPGRVGKLSKGRA